MLIVGTGGLAKQVISSFAESSKDWVFYNDVDIEENRFFSRLIIHDLLSVKKFYKNEKFKFSIAVSNLIYKKKIAKELIKSGGVFTSICSLEMKLWKDFDVEIEEGVIILQNVLIEPNTLIKRGSLVNVGVQIHHDVQIGAYCEVGPMCCLAGNVSIGDGTFIGANSTILPGIMIGDNCIIGAGSVVVNNILDNEKVKGVPAR